MEKNLITMFFATIALSAAMTFSSCSKDGDESQGGVSTSSINPLNVFTGGLPKGLDDIQILTDAKGRVYAMKSSDKNVTFEYREESTRSIEKGPDVIMTIIGSDEKQVCNLFLNKKGFVQYCTETQYNRGYQPDEDTWSFTYNNDGQLIKMVRSEGFKTTTMKYHEGNIVETLEVSNEDNSHKNLSTIFYTSDKVTTPIVNKGCIMLFDTTLGIDMDEMEYAYYAGLLGKAIKNLPVKCVDDEGNVENYSWKLNSTGYPTQMKSEHGSYSFIW